MSLNPFVATAVAEQVSAPNAATYLRRRAARADRARFDEVSPASAVSRRTSDERTD
ncbi:MAG: hypothetical protein ACREH3_11725 [Geminicoccales bacterium]